MIEQPPIPHAYREPAEPPPLRFPLRMSLAARSGLAALAGAIALTVVIWALTGSVFLLVLAAGGPGLFYLLSGAPRALVVTRDEVRLRSWLRPVRRVPTASILSIQVDDDDLLVVTREHTLAVPLAQFSIGDIDRAVEALRAR